MNRRKQLIRRPINEQRRHIRYEFNKLNETALRHRGRLTYRKLFTEITAKSNKLTEAGYDATLIESEIKYLLSEGLFGFVSDLFSGGWGALKEKIVWWVMTKVFKVSDGKFKDFAVILGGNLSFSDIFKFLNPRANCPYLTEKLVQSFVEWGGRELCQRSDMCSGLMGNLTRNIFHEWANDTELMKRLTGTVEDVVCSALGNIGKELKGTIQDKVDKNMEQGGDDSGPSSAYA